MTGPLSAIDLLKSSEPWSALYPQRPGMFQPSRLECGWSAFAAIWPRCEGSNDPPRDQATPLQQLNKPDATNANQTPGAEELSPCRFLIASSLETAGSEP